MSADGSRIYVPDLGLDKIYFHRVKDFTLQPEIVTNVKPGSGPRHLVESPKSSTTMYGINELNGEINRYNVRGDGSLELANSFPSNPTQSFESGHSGAAIVASDKGFLFVSIRV
jgi:6-phosphogluconolactonase